VVSFKKKEPHKLFTKETVGQKALYFLCADLTVTKEENDLGTDKIRLRAARR